MIDDVVVAFEDPVREPVVPHILPNVFDRIEFWRFGGQRDERHVFGHVQLCGDVPTGLINEQHRMGSRLNLKRDRLQMQFHGLGVAKWQNETGRLSERGADRSEDIGGGGSLILQGEGARAALSPAPCDLVLLANASFVLEPQFERLAGGRRDIREDIGDFFLNASTAASSCS